VVKLRERISVHKRARHECDLETFYLKKFDDIEVKEEYQVEISTCNLQLATLEILDENFDINNAW
jgi:hypothetical protein